MKQLLLLLLLVGLLISCSKESNYNTSKVGEVLVHQNKNKPNKPSLKIKLRKKFELKSDEKCSLRKIGYFSYDKKDKLFYIFDYQNKTINVFSANGKYLTKFGGKGSGPGEFTENVEITILNDTIYAFEKGAVSKFSKDYHFIAKTNIKNNATYYKILPYNNNSFICECLGMEFKDEVWHRGVDILACKLDSLKFSKRLLSSWWNIKEDFKNPYTYFNNTFAKVVMENKLFLANKSKDKYAIDIYELQNDKLLKKEIIRKSYRKEKIKEKDYATIKKAEEKMISEYVSGKELEEGLKNSMKFYNFRIPILALFGDYKNRLWVSKGLKALEEKPIMLFDIFKEGKFLNSIELSLDIAKSSEMYQRFRDVKIIDNLILTRNVVEDKITVYEISN